MNRLMNNGDIILNGDKTREQLTKKAFKKLDDVETIMEQNDIGSMFELDLALHYYKELKESILNLKKVGSK